MKMCSASFCISVNEYNFQKIIGKFLLDFFLILIVFLIFPVSGLHVVD